MVKYSRYPYISSIEICVTNEKNNRGCITVTSDNGGKFAGTHNLPVLL